MHRTHTRWIPWTILSVLVVTLAGCGGGGGGGGGTIQALTLPDRIEISQTEDGGAGARPGAAPGLYSDEGTDYSLAEKQTWTEDTDALGTINDILGVVQETRYEDFVNAGPYKALVSKVGDESESQGGASTTSSTTESLMEMIVNVTRASNSAPMIVKVWLEEPDGPGGQTMRIRGYFEVTRGVSDDYPYGAMEAHFQGRALDGDGNEGAVLFTMVMTVDAQDGQVIIEGVEDGDEGDSEWTNEVRLIVNSDLTEGNAYQYEYRDDPWGGIQESTTYFAFDPDYLKSKADGVTTAYDKRDFDYKVYRYNLFNLEDGEEVTRNSGFPIRLESGEYGYVGYYGLWLPQGVSAEDGDTVTRVGTDAEYTLFHVKGKLTKHTRSSIALGELTGTEMSKFDCGPGGCTDSIVTWDGAEFKKIGERDPQTGQVTYLAPGEQTTVTFQPWEGAWCEQLKSFLRLGTLTLYTNESIVPFHTEQTVNPAIAEDLTLSTWGFALDAPITQEVIDSADESGYWSSPSLKTYTFDSTGLVLKDGDGTAVLLADGVDLDGTRYSGGIHIGPLTASPYPEESWWEANDADVYYTWQTGSNSWNQFTTVREVGGEAVQFSAPLRMTYTHSTENDLNGAGTYDGKRFTIEYDGSELRVPWEFDEVQGKWAPLFNLRDGVLLSGGGGDYVVKGVEQGLLLAELADPSEAEGLEIDETIDPPTATYDATKIAQVGAVPVGAELKVSRGERVD